MKKIVFWKNTKIQYFLWIQCVMKKGYFTVQFLAFILQLIFTCVPFIILVMVPLLKIQMNLLKDFLVILFKLFFLLMINILFVFVGHQEYIKNLYFLYLIELRALHKSEQFLLNKVNWQSIGDQSQTKEAIKVLLRTVR